MVFVTQPKSLRKQQLVTRRKCAFDFDPELSSHTFFRSLFALSKAKPSDPLPAGFWTVTGNRTSKKMENPKTD